MPPKPPPPKQRSSKAITLTVIGVVSVMVVGYCAATQDDDEVTADCVDTSQQLPDGSYPVVDEDYCDDDHHSHYYAGPRGAYHWYYGGVRNGTRVRGGTTLRPSDVTISTRTGREIQRGGFGSGRSSGS
ncbi:hypothetical protein ACBI99_08685 [Nonomuraea sp. ATR24]|uniref:hypothetical protein n=1 Tax=Nonomuraea TaxID=83681 RepID=UPI001C603375|nr:hypothetical protein [Nonomuraea ceibae]